MVWPPGECGFLGRIDRGLVGMRVSWIDSQRLKWTRSKMRSGREILALLELSRHSLFIPFLPWWKLWRDWWFWVSTGLVRWSGSVYVSPDFPVFLYMESLNFRILTRKSLSFFGVIYLLSGARETRLVLLFNCYMIIMPRVKFSFSGSMMVACLKNCFFYKKNSTWWM